MDQADVGLCLKGAPSAAATPQPGPKIPGLKLANKLSAKVTARVLRRYTKFRAVESGGLLNCGTQPMPLPANVKSKEVF